jgi:hypothetical protein
MWSDERKGYGVMQDLNTLLVNGSGWTVHEAWDINGAGQIAAFGCFDEVIATRCASIRWRSFSRCRNPRRGCSSVLAGGRGWWRRGAGRRCARM